MSRKKTYLRRIGASPVHQFLMRVPLDVVDRLRGRIVLIPLPPCREEGPLLVRTKVGTFVKFSVRTPNLETARAREAVALFELRKVFNAARQGPTVISQRQMVALAGGVYRLFTDAFRENPGNPEKWAAWKAFNRAAGEGRIIHAPPIQAGPFDETEAANERFGPDLTIGVNALPRSDAVEGLEARFGEITNWLLAHEGIEVDEQTRKSLLREVYRAAQDAGYRLKRNAGGDYRPDPMEGRFPPYEKHPHLTLSELFERWKNEVKPAASTVMTWRGVLNSFKTSLGHESVRQITQADVIKWKDALVASGLKSKTINDSYLGGLRAILNFALANHMVSENPAQNVRAASPKTAGQRQLPYTDEEVAQLLRIAKAQTNPARRWLPWLAALTGARIGELAQLWAEDVTIDDGVPLIHIRETPDGGRLKNPHSERRVPVHPALIEEGFLNFVAAKRNGPLFYGRSSGNPEKRHASKALRITWPHGFGGRDSTMPERRRTTLFVIGGKARRFVWACKIVRPTQSRVMRGARSLRRTCTSI